ncbi:MAG: hypothetical protein IIA27_15755 [Gemmatimonadetes bacterium]|nr:hypothetical protein [Gemmatimonadota bacterium]
MQRCAPQGCEHEVVLGLLPLGCLQAVPLLAAVVVEASVEEAEGAVGVAEASVEEAEGVVGVAEASVKKAEGATRVVAPAEVARVGEKGSVRRIRWATV